MAGSTDVDNAPASRIDTSALSLRAAKHADRRARAIICKGMNRGRFASVTIIRMERSIRVGYTCT